MGWGSSPFSDEIIALKEVLPNMTEQQLANLCGYPKQALQAAVFWKNFFRSLYKDDGELFKEICAYIDYCSIGEGWKYDTIFSDYLCDYFENERQLKIAEAVKRSKERLVFFKGPVKIKQSEKIQ